jgi:SpoVK/Ycf46/Vps4 family AAA+-type ATPase
VDAALRRPGRLDHAVYVPPPDYAARVAVLAVHTRAVPLAPDVDLAAVAAATPGFSCADLENLCREAAMGALRTALQRGSDVAAVVVDRGDFERALCGVQPSLRAGELAEYERMASQVV